MRAAAAWLAALLVGLACATPSPRGVERPLGLDDPRLAALLDGLRDGAATRTSMRGSARLSLDAPDLRFGTSLRVAAERPARLRVEILAPILGQTLALLVTRDRTYQFADPGEGIFEEGAVTPGLLWSVARVNLQPAEAVELLLGASVPDTALTPGSAWERSDGGVDIEMLDASGRISERLEFSAYGLLRHLEMFDDHDRLVRAIDFDDYKDLDGKPFAHEAKLRFPLYQTRATFRFSRVELNPSLPDGLFYLQLPERVSSAPGG